MRQCEICKEGKPSNEFSKSYPRRCKACVAAEQRRLRALEKNEVLGEIPKCSKPIEDKRYELARYAMCAMLSNQSLFDTKMSPCSVARNAIKIADELLSELENPTAECTG